MTAILKIWYDVTTINRSKSKQEAQFQYGGCPFSEKGSSFILAVGWGISSKFGKQMDIHLLKRLPLRNLNEEVDFRFYGRHLEKSIWRHNFAADSPITTKFDRLMQNGPSKTINKSKSKPEVPFQYAGRPISKAEGSFILAVDWLYLIKI